MYGACRWSGVALTSPALLFHRERREKDNKQRLLLFPLSLWERGRGEGPAF
jgi:hypothetical protein